MRAAGLAVAFKLLTRAENACRRANSPHLVVTDKVGDE